MPELAPIGRIADLESLDLEPLTVPIVGYDQKKKEVIVKIRFVGMLPAGASLDMIRATDSNGKVSNAAALDYVDACVLEEDRVAWDEMLHGTRVTVRLETLLEVYQALAAFYTKRPTKRPSASRGGRGRIQPTSPAAASGKR